MRKLLDLLLIRDRSKYSEEEYNLMKKLSQVEKEFLLVGDLYGLNIRKFLSQYEETETLNDEIKIILISLYKIQ